LVGFALWTVALITLVFLVAVLLTRHAHQPLAAGQQPQDDASLVKRLGDAHANWHGKPAGFRGAGACGPASWARGTRFERVAPFVLYARIGQTLAHLWGTGPLQVFVRASFWSAQLVICLWMAVQLLAA